jgi:hypothetical protein
MALLAPSVFSDHVDEHQIEHGRQRPMRLKMMTALMVQ